MASGEDFIPDGNGKFDAWQKNFINQVNGFMGGWDFNTTAQNE